jgi:hypothetical protein
MLHAWQQFPKDITRVTSTIYATFDGEPMKNLTVSKKLMAIFAISVLASFAIPAALAAGTGPTAPVPIPSACTTAETAAGTWNSIPVVNAHYTITGDEDAGNVGIWAVDNYVEGFIIWQFTPAVVVPAGDTFCVLLQQTGNNLIPAGAITPADNTTIQPMNGIASFHGVMIALFTGDFNGPFCSPRAVAHNRPCSKGGVGTYSTEPLTGGLGKFNFGGTAATVLAQQLPPGIPAYTGPFYWNTFYFTNFSWSPGYLYWSETSTLGNGIGYGHMWIDDVNGNGVIGNIIT